jgi:hypothetical protein
MSTVRGMAAPTENQTEQHALARLAQVLANTPEIAFAILIGSRAKEHDKKHTLILSKCA